MMLEVSLGDALDKLSILEIKRSRITDPKKLEEIHKEILALSAVPKTNALLYDLLVEINTIIWDLTDTVKSKTEIDIEYAEISRSIFDNNQKRFRVKNMINYSEVGSLKEQKSYQLSQAAVDVTDVAFAIPAIYALCTMYDQVVVIDGHDELRKIFTTPNVLFSEDVLGIPRYKDTFLETSVIDRYTPKPTVT